jgi:Zn-dependent protease
MSSSVSVVQAIVVAIIPLIFAITAHEAAHGWVASKLGDKTALMLGRVTLNPVKHIDLIGTIILPFIMLILGGFIFGWAKPVPIGWQNLKNPRRDMALVAIAGPLANFIMAFIWAGIAKLAVLYLSNQSQPWISVTGQFLQAAANFGILINCWLMVLNLLPIPPLDGSRIISSILPAGAAYQYEKLEAFGIWILLGLLFLGVFKYLWPPLLFLMKWIGNIFGINT